MILGDMEIRLRADIARLQQDLNNARRSVDSAMGSIGDSVKRAMGLLAGLGIGLSIGSLVNQVIAAQREFDKLNASLITATGSTTNAAQAFAALKAFAASTPYSVQEATESFIKMRNLGLDPSERALRSYGNTASSMGKGLNQMIEAVADAATGEFERLKEFGIKAKQNGDLVSLTFQGVTKSIGNNAKEIEKYLQAIGEKEFAGGMDRRAATLDGAISNLGDTWSNTLRTISSNGIGDAAMGGVLALSAALTDLSAILDAVGGAARKEGEQVKEAGILHKALTTIFEAVAVLGVNVFYVLTQIGKELGGIAAQAKAVASGDFAGAAAIGKQMKIDAEADRIAVDAKSAAIIGASKKAQEAQEAQAAAQAKSGKDRLAQYALVLTAEEKRNQALLDMVTTEQRITGVSAESLADLKKLKTALDTGAISQEKYNFLKGKLTEQMYQNSLLGKDEVKSIEKSIEAIKKRAELTAILNDREKDRIAFLQRTGQLNEEQFLASNGASELKALTDQRNALSDEMALLKRKHDSQKEQAALSGQIAAANEKIKSREIKQDQDLLELEHKRYLLASENYADVIDHARAEAKSQQDALRDQKDSNDQLWLTEKQIAAVNAARLNDLAARAEENALIAEGLDLSGQLSQSYRDQAEALRQRAVQTTSGAELKAQRELWGSIEQTAHDTFVSIFDSGKNAFDRLRDTLKNGLLDLLYQMTIKKWILNIGASVGVGGTGTLAQAASALSGGTGAASSNPLIGMAQSASSIYKVISGGFETLSTTVADTVQAGMYGSGMSGQIASNGSFATGAGAVASTAAAYMAGAALNKAISGQYSTGSGVMTAQKVATAVASYINPVLGVAVGAISGLFNRAFGMSDTKLQAQGISGSLSSSGATGSSYQNLHQDGGWFRSDKNWTETKAFTSEMTAQFSQGFEAIKSASAGFATSLGASVESISTYSKNFNIQLTSDAAANEKAIADFFVGVGDEIALRLVPNLADFSKTGETVSATLERLAGDFQATNQVAMLMGVSGKAMFGSLGIESAAARERLIGLAGGVSNLSAQASTFAQNYLTEAERLAPVSEAVAAAMSSLGLASVTTREQFKLVVQSLDVTTAAGAQQFASMMALADSFAQVHPLVEATTAALRTESDILSERNDLQKQFDQATMTSAQLRAKERLAIDASNLALFDQITNLQTIAATSDALKTSIDKLKTFKDGILSFRDSLTLGSLSTLNPMQKAAEAQRQYEDMLAKAKAGDETARAGIQGAATAYLTADQIVKASSDAYVNDAMKVQADLMALADAAGAQISVDQLQLTALDSQVTQMTVLNAKVEGLRDDNTKLREDNAKLLAAVQDQTAVLATVIMNSADANAEKVNDGAKNAGQDRAYVASLDAEAIAR